MCIYCTPKHYTSSGELAHGEDMVNNDGIDSFGDISACIWRDGVLHIETKVDNLYASIKIRYCPKCGQDLSVKKE